MTDLEHFEGILKRYIVSALRLAGVSIDTRMAAIDELQVAFEGLERAIREIANDEISKREMQLSGDW